MCEAGSVELGGWEAWRDCDLVVRRIIIVEQDYQVIFKVVCWLVICMGIL